MKADNVCYVATTRPLANPDSYGDPVSTAHWSGLNSWVYSSACLQDYHDYADTQTYNYWKISNVSWSDNCTRLQGQTGGGYVPFELPLVATVEGEQRSIRWQITGTRRSRVAVSPIYLNFGESNVAGRPPVSRTVAVFLDDSAQTFGANSSSDLIRVVGRPGLNGGIRLVVTPDTTRIRGDFAGTILVTAIGHDGQVTGSTTVAVEGTVREPEPSRPADGGKQP